MAQLDERALKQQLKDGNFERLYFIFGDEGYLKQFYANLIPKKCVTPGMEGFNYKKYDATQGANLDEVIVAAQTLPAFGGYTCVQAKDFPLDTLVEGQKKELIAFVEDIPDTTVLVFWQDTNVVDLKRNRKYQDLVSLFQKHGATVQLNKLDRTSLCKLLMSAANKRGCSLDRTVAAYLIELVGDDLVTLQNEIEKLCNFKKDGTIEKNDVDEICVKSLEATVFDLSRALMQNNGAKAFAVLEKLFADKEKPELILGTMIAAYMDMYRAKVAMAAGEKADYPAKIFNYKNKEFRLRNAARDGQKISLSELEHDLDVLNAADRKLKIRVVDEKIILEKLLIELLRSEE